MPQYCYSINHLQYNQYSHFRFNVNKGFKINAHKTSIQQYDGSHFKNTERRQEGSLSLGTKLEVTNAADT